MENLQAKLQRGLSSIQKGIEGGKDKIQTTQEVLSLKGKVSEIEKERTKLILSLGEITYRKLRNDEIHDEEIIAIGEEIVELDKNIFNLLKSIEEKTKTEDRPICQCGTPLTSEDKFCKNCGTKVEITKTGHEEKTICKVCQTEILASSKFCNCCGAKIN